MKIILKNTIVLLLFTTLFSCNNSNDDPSDADYYVTAKIQGAGYDVDFISQDLVLALKTKVQTLVIKKIVVVPKDENIEFGFHLNYESFLTTEPETKNELFGITKIENGEPQLWQGPGLIQGLQGASPDANFTITNETSTFIEGTFNFKAMRTDPSTLNVLDTIYVTNGKFKANKTY